MSEVPQIIEFDETRAMRYNPPRILQIVRIVEKPANEETVIMTMLAGRLTFVGTYVEVLDPSSNKVQYAYGYDYFMKTHTPWEGVENGWYVSAPADAYQADAEGELPAEGKSGALRVHIGDWIFRELDGKVTRVSADIFSLIFDLDSAHPIPRESE